MCSPLIKLISENKEIASFEMVLFKNTLQLLFKQFPPPIPSSCLQQTSTWKWDITFEVSFYSFSPNLYRFLWPILFLPKWGKKKNLLFLYPLKNRKIFLNSNSDSIDTAYVFQKQSKSLLSSILGKAFNDIF